MKKSNQQIDASDAALTDEGFQYFVECQDIKKLKLNFTDYFGDEAIRTLSLGRPVKTLQELVTFSAGKMVI